MYIIAQCPVCRYKWYLDGLAVDRRVLCQKCGQLFKIPHLNEIPRAKRVIEQARGKIVVDKNGKTYG